MYVINTVQALRCRCVYILPDQTSNMHTLSQLPYMHMCLVMYVYRSYGLGGHRYIPSLNNMLPYQALAPQYPYEAPFTSYLLLLVCLEQQLQHVLSTRSYVGMLLCVTTTVRLHTSLLIILYRLSTLYLVRTLLVSTCFTIVTSLQSINRWVYMSSQSYV